MTSDTLSFETPPEDGGRRLDHVLAAMAAGHSRSQLQRLIREGMVRVNGTVEQRPSASLHSGDRITVELPPPQSTTPLPEALPLDILFQDADIVVLDKPAGMVVHPAAGHGEGTLVNALLHHISDLSGIGGERRPGIVHRLDKGTSGLMVIAKHDRAHAELARQFEDREVEKEYAVLVWGVVQAGRRIEASIGRDPVMRQKMSTRSRRARSAVTRVTHAEHFPGVSLIHVAIATGRTHQIRVHLSEIGHPVVGDALYGGIHRRVPPHLSGVQRLERPFLHARRLAFTHPSDGQRLEFESALPADLQEVLDRVRAGSERHLGHTYGGLHGSNADD